MSMAQYNSCSTSFELSISFSFLTAPFHPSALRLAQEFIATPVPVFQTSEAARGIDTSSDASTEVCENTLNDTAKEAKLHGPGSVLLRVVHWKFLTLSVDTSQTQSVLLFFALSTREI